MEGGRERGEGEIDRWAAAGMRPRTLMSVNARSGWGKLLCREEVPRHGVFILYVGGAVVTWLLRWQSLRHLSPLRAMGGRCRGFLVEVPTTSFRVPFALRGSFGDRGWNPAVQGRQRIESASPSFFPDTGKTLFLIVNFLPAGM